MGEVITIVLVVCIACAVGLRDFKNHQRGRFLEQQAQHESERIEKSVETYRKTLPPGALARYDSVWDLTPPPLEVHKKRATGSGKL